jgi:hypothetical protein
VKYSDKRANIHGKVKKKNATQEETDIYYILPSIT